MTTQCDLLVVGGGIVGLAAAYQYQRRYPGNSVVLLEKEAELAFHQTGRNSGVLHSGIYYKPGTMRAKNCRAGKQAMVDFCQAEGVAYDLCGKVIVAVGEEELPALEKIYERGKANGVVCEMIGRERLCELEPHTAGIRALHVPEAGIVDFKGVCQRLAANIERAGGQIVLQARVTGMHPNGTGIIAESTAGEFPAKRLVNCAGLYSDRVATMSGKKPEVQILPFRGEYFELVPTAWPLCRNLIYPVPNPSFPFLGVHFTRMVTGGVECGPNAVLAWAREGYRKSDINLRELAEAVSYRGFRRMAAKYWRIGLGEMWRSLSKSAFVRALQRLVPEIRSEDLHTGPAGVRAMAVSPGGELVDDFIIEKHDHVVNVCNAPSPAATSALNIGSLIVDALDAA
ncbi:MAG TPA: L-2-hydroxyglutarate oxidase [Pirellulales bacterium]|jgi:L-2-hydroxyglutarate oxidase|nr:L-2-hydroxyglutarate oxidase [Pirellulales bacterium]